MVVAQVVPDVHDGEHVGDVPVGVVEVHQVGEHFPQCPRLRVGSHQGDLGPGALTARLDELGRAAEEVRITRKALLGLPDPGPPALPAPKLQAHPAYQQIMEVFTLADHPLRVRQVCEAMDLAVAPTNIDNVRPKLKRLAGRGTLTETAPGLFTQPRP
ncbi:hypothetical protein [Streptomyces scabiei]|uniref:hypothetical protein n=1 Tax=Streptomyces scabiei TaxID=1930 RepID=UPI0029AA7BA7|nr:hypothetical protein [Streptomyces scabiei]MDX3523633.1 hypothetical protein [Streptomyces scabiei]